MWWVVVEITVGIVSLGLRQSTATYVIVITNGIIIAVIAFVIISISQAMIINTPSTISLTSLITWSNDKVCICVRLLVVKGVVLLSSTVLRSKTSFIILTAMDFVDIKVKVMTK